MSNGLPLNPGFSRRPDPIFSSVNEEIRPFCLFSFALLLPLSFVIIMYIEGRFSFCPFVLHWLDFLAFFTTWLSATSSSGYQEVVQWRMAWDLQQPWRAWWTSTTTLWTPKTALSRLKAVRINLIFSYFMTIITVYTTQFCWKFSLDKKKKV